MAKSNPDYNSIAPELLNFVNGIRFIILDQKLGGLESKFTKFCKRRQ